MQDSKIYDFLELIHDISNTPVCYIDTYLKTIEYCKGDVLLPNFNNKVISNILNNIGNHKLIVIPNPFEINNAIYIIPVKYKNNHIHGLIAFLRMDGKSEKAKDHAFFMSLAQLTHLFIYREHIALDDAADVFMSGDMEPVWQKNVPKGNYYSSHVMLRIQHRIRTGNIGKVKEETEEYLDLALNSHLEPSVPFQNLRKALCALVGICFYSALKGGISYDMAQYMYKTWINKIDAVRESNYSDFIRKLFIAFASQLYLEARKDVSKPVVFCQDYIMQHLGERIVLKQLACELGINPSYLSIMFRRECGISFGEYLSRARVEEAKIMLRTAGMPLAEIAAALGFTDQSHFSKSFSKYSGMTPSMFRSKPRKPLQPDLPA